MLNYRLDRFFILADIFEGGKGHGYNNENEKRKKAGDLDDGLAMDKRDCLFIILFLYDKSVVSVGIRVGFCFFPACGRWDDEGLFAISGFL